MMSLKHINLNLGIPKLAKEWKEFFSTKDLLADFFAGTTVAFVAIHLSLAIALASGVSPGTGLITAIIAGIVCAFFGGTKLAVSGPAAAMCILIADVVEKYGVESLFLIGGIAGVMQLISGILGLGKIARYVPLPVISGFTAGIGVIIIIGQLPRAFGLLPPPESHVFSVFGHLKDYLHDINGACVLLVFTTIFVIKYLPKVLPKVPAILPAVVFTSLIAYFFQLTTVPVIGEIPSSLPSPSLPKLGNISWQDAFFSAFIIYLLASLETLLSSSAVDKMVAKERHDSDQELIGQGLGNIASSIFSGIPITGVIARSATNVKSGAKTRRSGIIHSLIILVAIYTAAPLIGSIPIAALAGVLFYIAFSMINYQEFYDLLKTSRSEAMIYAVTFFTIIFVDLLAGVQAGIAAACLILLVRTNKTDLHISSDQNNDITRLTLDGALTFLSIGKIADLQKQLPEKIIGKTLLVDLSRVRQLDASGAATIVELYNYCLSRNTHFFIKGLSKQFEKNFKIAGGDLLIQNCSVVSECELKKLMQVTAPSSAYGRLTHGVQKFHLETKQKDSGLFERISVKQEPHTLLITCSDSRIVPSLITSSEPGELFIIRNIGNFVPPYDKNSKFSETAAIEFALNSFDITDIVVCGHANCGAIQACQVHGEALQPAINSWVDLIRKKLKISNNLIDMIHSNVKNQIENLKTYPSVQKKIKNKQLCIHGWFFDFDKKMVYELNENSLNFNSIIEEFEENQLETVESI